MSMLSCYHLQLSLQHFTEVTGQATQVLMSLLHLSLETPPEFVTEELLLVGKVNDALLHPCKLGGKKQLEFTALRIYLRIRPKTFHSLSGGVIINSERWLHYSFTQRRAVQFADSIILMQTVSRKAEKPAPDTQGGPSPVWRMTHIFSCKVRATGQVCLPIIIMSYTKYWI